MSNDDSQLVGPGAPVSRDAAEAGPASPLSEADLQLLRRAAAAYRPVRNAARTAYISAVSILGVAVLAVPFVIISPGLTHLVIVVSLAIIGYLEYAGAAKMRRGMPQAASHLGWNQVLFISLICIYCIGRMLDASSTEYLSPEARDQLSELPELTIQLESVVPLAIKGFYLLVILVSVVIQGSLAGYYFTRRKYLEALERSTPAWVRRVFDAVAG